MHCPVCEFPGLRPTNVHVLSAYDDHYEVNTIHAYTGAETRPSGWSHSGLDTIDSPLAQHQVSIVPFVGPPVAIRVLLDRKELGAN